MEKHTIPPYVSVIIPMRNEERYIAGCLRSLLHCGYPAQRWEILVVDGMSVDGSRMEVERVGRQAATPVYLLENPRGITPIALNIGLAQARGEIIIRIDAHAEYGQDYITRCVQVLEESGVDNVGGPVVTRPGADTAVARAIALAMAHPFGVGDSNFRTRREAVEVDTVPFGCFRADVFRRIGLFDERLARNQDYEFNQRLRRAGSHIRLDPRLESVYISRPTWRGLYKQAWENGYWNALTHHLHAYSRCLRHTLPMAFASGIPVALACALLFALGHSAAWAAIPAILLCTAYLLYLLVDFSVSTRLAALHGWRLWLPLLLTFPAFHTVYGAGLVAGWTHALLRRYPWQPGDGIPTWEERRQENVEKMAA